MKKYILIMLIASSTTLVAQNVAVNDGGFLKIAGGVTLSFDGDVEHINNGELKGNGTLEFNSLTSSAMLNVGEDTETGLITINGTLNNTANSSIDLKISGTAGFGVVNGNDGLYIDGDVNLGNTLNITAIDGFVPNSNMMDVFVIIQYTGTLNSNFTTVNLPPNMSNNYNVDYGDPGVIKLVHDQLSVPENALANVQVYPNPATNTVFIGSNQYRFETVKIHDITGRLITEKAITNNSVDTRSLSSGVYFFEFSTEENEQTTKKIIIN